jgi:hypothetical protein
MLQLDGHDELQILEVSVKIELGGPNVKFCGQNVLH